MLWPPLNATAVGHSSHVVRSFDGPRDVDRDTARQPAPRLLASLLAKLGKRADFRSPGNRGAPAGGGVAVEKDELGNYTEASAPFPSQRLRKSRRDTADLRSIDLTNVCDPYIRTRRKRHAGALPLRTTAGSAKSRIETRRGFRIRGKRPCSAWSDLAARTSIVSETDR
jgi:hypothetical protein